MHSHRAPVLSWAKLLLPVLAGLGLALGLLWFVHGPVAAGVQPPGPRPTLTARP